MLREQTYLVTSDTSHGWGAIHISRVLRCVTLVAMVCVVAMPPAAATTPGHTIGTSRDGIPIRAFLIGEPDAEVRIVVLGQMHGDEPAGRRVISALRGLKAPEGTAFWLIPTMNPDGYRERTRTNRRGVDLNRNFPMQWRAQDRGTHEWSGPRAASEPETRAVMGFLKDVQPTALLSFHQPFGIVDITHAPARKVGRQLARWMDLPARAVGCSGPCRGTLTEWATAELDAIAITVELPAVVTQSDVNRAARAVERLTHAL